ncbi:MAG TPA: divalent-cation tolerance protein CutA [Myxococcota bacterium]|jgi:periplasmic divalent cation tolerance protein
MISVLLSAAPTADVAKTIARALVEERLVACVNIIAGVTSVYRWQGAVHEDAEVMLVMKTAPERVAAVAARLRELHPYEVPELIALPSDTALPAYAQWVLAETAPIAV